MAFIRNQLQLYGDFCRPTIDGTWKNFVTDYGAVGDGVVQPNGSMLGTDNSSALSGWLTFATSQGSALAKLYMPPGNYHLATTNGFTSIDNSPTFPAAQNATISGWGAAVDAAFIGPIGSIFQDQVHSSRFGTTSAGATSITLINSGAHSTSEISRFSVGQWVMISGLGLQNYGYPPNFQYNEYRQITGTSAATISFTDPLLYSYGSTWPEIDAKAITVTSATPAVVTLNNHGYSANQTVVFDFNIGGAVPSGVTRYQTYFVSSTSLATSTFQFSATQGGPSINTTSTGTSVILHTSSTDLGGPGTVYALNSNFQSSVTVYGVRFTGQTQVSVVGGAGGAFLCGCQFDGDGPSATIGRSVKYRRTQFGNQNEIDKSVTRVEYQECSSTTGLRQLLAFSTSIDTLVLRDCNILTLNGCALHTEIYNCQVGTLFAGAIAYGHASTMIADGCAIGAAASGAVYVLLSTLTFSGGTFSIETTQAGTVFQTIVPGRKMAFGIFAGGLVITDDSSNITAFSVLSFRQNSTTTFIDTDIGNSLPSLTFQGGSATLIANFPFDTGGVTQTNCTGANLNIPAFVAP